MGLIHGFGESIDAVASATIEHFVWDSIAADAANEKMMNIVRNKHAANRGDLGRNPYWDRWFNSGPMVEVVPNQSKN